MHSISITAHWAQVWFLRLAITLLTIPLRLFSGLVWNLESIRARLVTRLDNYLAT